MALSGGRYHSFLVRIWSQQREVVQGEVVHVGSRQRMRFRDLQHMLAFMLTNLARPEPGSTNDEEKDER